MAPYLSAFLSEFNLPPEAVQENWHGNTQQLATDFYRGWDSATDGPGTDTENAESHYVRMVARGVSLGVVNKKAFVAGWIAACMRERSAE